MLIEEIKNNSIKIKGIKVANDLPIEVEKPLPSHNHFSLFVGLPGSGKTTLVLNLLTRYYKKSFDRIYFFSGSLHTLPDKFVAKLHSDRVFTDLDNLESIMAECQENDHKCLFVFDDLVKEVKEKDKLIMKLSMNRRHIGKGVSIWMITQKLKNIPLTIRSQIDSVYFFYASAKNKKEVESLFDDYITELDRDEYLQLLKYVFKGDDKNMFLYMDKKNGKFFKRFNELRLNTD